MSEWVSEWILNGTSAQLGYRVPFRFVHAGKYRTEDQLKIETIQKLNTTHKSKHRKTAKQNYPGSVASYDTQPGNEVGLFYTVTEKKRPPLNKML